MRTFYIHECMYNTFLHCHFYNTNQLPVSMENTYTLCVQYYVTYAHCHLYNIYMYMYRDCSVNQCMGKKSVQKIRTQFYIHVTIVIYICTMHVHVYTCVTAKQKQCCITLQSCIHIVYIHIYIIT